MKYFFIVFSFSFYISVFSQTIATSENKKKVLLNKNEDCSKFINIETDKFTGRTLITRKRYIVIPSRSDSKIGIKILNAIAGEKMMF